MNMINSSESYGSSSISETQYRVARNPFVNGGDVLTGRFGDKWMGPDCFSPYLVQISISDARRAWNVILRKVCYC